VYSTEYGSYPSSYYIAAIEQGRILVSNHKVTTNYRIKGGDVLSHTVHRHEPSIAVQTLLAPYVTIVHETDDVLIVDKPATMPVHPCGGYNMQSLVTILQRHYFHHTNNTSRRSAIAETGTHTATSNSGTAAAVSSLSSTEKQGGLLLQKLHPVHRLDRLTSGLVILGKNSTIAKTLGTCILNRNGCQKIYLARVRGRFPFALSSASSALRPVVDTTTIPTNNANNYTHITHNTIMMMHQRQYEEHGDAIPLHGEWAAVVPTENSKKSTNTTKHNNNNNSNDVACLRKQHAHVYWIEDEDGNPILLGNVDQKQDSEATTSGNGSNENSSTEPNRFLEQVFHCRHSVDAWLASIGNTDNSDTATTDTKNSTINSGTITTTANSKLTSTVFRWFHIACPVRIAHHKDGICEANSFADLDDNLYKKTVKPSHSSFGVVSYDQRTDSTLLICRPYTGRTHQLRLHLQHLGHPIANDPNYGGDIWYKNPNGEKLCHAAKNKLNATYTNTIQVGSSLSTVSNHNGVAINGESDRNVCEIATNKKKLRTGTSTAATTFDTGITAVETAKRPRTEELSALPPPVMTDVPATEMEITDGISSSCQGTDESIHDFIERTCVWCARSRRHENNDHDHSILDRSVLEFLVRSSGIWLHALQYTFETTTTTTTTKTTTPASMTNNYTATSATATTIASVTDTNTDDKNKTDDSSTIKNTSTNKTDTIVTTKTTFRTKLPPWHDISNNLLPDKE